MNDETLPESSGNMGNEATKILETCLELIAANYLSPDGDFNGLPLDSLADVMKRGWPELRPVVIDLVQRGSVNVHWEEVDSNPHINRRGFAQIAAQLDYLAQIDDVLHHTCLYPSSEYLALVVPPHAYSDRPYTRELALGASQLSFRSFDLHVLETYRNDPRYYYTCSDIGGSICISTEGSDGAHPVRESDQVLLQTFGFSYDDDANRAVAVFIRYLHGLSSEHQLLWRARQLSIKNRLHPDYYRSSVLGEWPEHLPLLQALCVEIWLINQMTHSIRGKKLFKNDYGKYGEDRPKKLALLIRTTLEEFNASVLLLDKVLSDNISTEFFKGAISLEIEHARADGSIEVRRKGTIALLDEYLRSVYRATDWSLWDEAIAALKTVRKLRQSPAHSIKEDEFDPKYAREFGALCTKAYSALATLRSCLHTHPAVATAGIDVPPQIQNGKVWTE